MFGLGWPEVFIILALLLLVFGPTQLPKIARDLGKAVREFQKASSGVMKEIDKATSDATKAIQPSSTRAVRSSISERARKEKGLSDIAKKLNITTEGKTNEQITQEIIMKIEGGEKASNNAAVKR